MEELLSRLRAWFFPFGEDQARGVVAATILEKGRMWAAPGARPTAFTAEERIDAKTTAFRWSARTGNRVHSVNVVEEYEEGHGHAAVTAGAIPLESTGGPDLDKGEMQRYLASMLLCPPMIVNNAALQWDSPADRLLRVLDRRDRTGAFLEIELDAAGFPIGCRAERPRMVGHTPVLTRWSATGSDFREVDGIRVAHRLEAAWVIAGALFPYFQEEIVSVEFLR